MKAALLLLIALFLGFVHSAQAQDRSLHWKYKDYDGAIAFTVPALAIDMGSWFIKDKVDRKLLRKVNKVRVLVFDDANSPVTQRDLKRFDRRASRRHLEDLVMVRDGKTHVRVMVKERRNKLRKVVVLVSEPETFALITVKGRLNIDDINRVIQKYGKDIKKDDDKPVVPEVLKVPVKRV